jgi:hypothetical protein
MQMLRQCKITYLLCKDSYKLILTTDCQKTDLTSRQVTALARPAATVNYRPVLSSERELQHIKQ